MVPWWYCGGLESCAVYKVEDVRDDELSVFMPRRGESRFVQVVRVRVCCCDGREHYM